MDKVQQAKEEIKKQINECDLSFAYKQGMQHALDIVMYYTEYAD